jgi:hypothetical protein
MSTGPAVVDAVEELLAEQPMRLYSPQEVRQIMFGPDIADDVRPTVYWLKRQAALGNIDRTPIARTLWFSAEDIRSLIKQHALGLYGRPKHPRTHGRRK